MGRRYATKLAATDNADHTITLSHPRPDRSRRVAVKVPSWALAVEREGARGRLQVTKAACACVICRGQKRVLLLRATAEAKRALVSAVEDGRPDPGTLVVDTCSALERSLKSVAEALVKTITGSGSFSCLIFLALGFVAALAGLRAWSIVR